MIEEREERGLSGAYDGEILVLRGAVDIAVGAWCADPEFALSETTLLADFAALPDRALG